MNTLTKEQVEIIKKGIAMECREDIRIHSAIQLETLELFTNYSNQLAFPQDYDDLDKETTYNALVKYCGFWTNVEEYGVEEAIERYIASREQ